MAPKRSRRNTPATTSQAPPEPEPFVPNYDPFLFRGIENQQKTLDKSFMNTHLATGRQVNVVELHNTRLIQLLHTQNWMDFVTLREDVYRRLVAEFYANIYILNKNSAVVYSYVRGVDIALTPEVLGTIFGLPTEGWNQFPSRGFTEVNYASNRVVPLANVLANLGLESTLNASALAPHLRVLHLILKHTLLPQSGNFAVITHTEAFFLWMLKKQKPISLPHLMLDHFYHKGLRTPRVFVYGMALTRIFRYFRVPFENPGRIIDAKDIIPLDHSTLHKNKIKILENGEWAYKTRGERDSSAYKGKGHASSSATKHTGIHRLVEQMDEHLSFHRAEAKRIARIEKQLLHLQQGFASTNPAFQPNAFDEDEEETSGDDGSEHTPMDADDDDDDDSDEDEDPAQFSKTPRTKRATSSDTEKYRVSTSEEESD